MPFLTRRNALDDFVGLYHARWTDLPYPKDVAEMIGEAERLIRSPHFRRLSRNDVNRLRAAGLLRLTIADREGRTIPQTETLEAAGLLGLAFPG